MHNLKIVLGGVQFTATLISVHFDLAVTVWDEQSNSKRRPSGLCIGK